ncbi:MAG: acyl-CoA reductase [Bacteroidetes bacterium]|nr:acyl-CoA reductase [Bacteroidota bacterium]
MAVILMYFVILQYEDMDIRNRIQTFIETGRILAGYPALQENGTPHPMSEPALRAGLVNPWFTPENIRFALNSLGHSLLEVKINRWLEAYSESLEIPGRREKRIGVVTAGNIPLAGFHDFFCVLICGHSFLGKLSAQDNVLLPAIAKIMEGFDPEWNRMIRFVNEPLKDIDAIIATGSDNTYRYFEYYFSRFPHIIRKSRNGIAILQGDETAAELEGLASDIMLYFGLGCRSVSKLYIPFDYDVLQLMPFFRPWEDIIRHNKYFNNYEYQKSIRIVNKQPFHDFGNLILAEDSKLASAVSVLNFERYRSKSELTEVLPAISDKIQCVVSTADPGIPFILPGTAQKPELWDYADGIDTLSFLLKEI